ncbi:MAG: tetratricopeptide repeat protein [Aestuariivita sp.]|nr:tetratricopeptide repeat protein [Aestuariivita sp.]MCY4203391.1 tetratricopeptide repeat protein [Aestuariivita sp.]
MLLSLTKVLLFATLMVGAAFGAEYLLGVEGSIRATFGGNEYTFNALHAAIAFLALMVVIWLFLKILGFLLAVWRFINGDETAISRYWFRNRERYGLQALSDSMIALASGEGSLAMAKAAKAERYLGRRDLTDLLTAQAAEIAGNSTAAATAYKKLISNDATRFVGIRGIIRQKLAEGDNDTALKLASKAFDIKPRHEETQDVLLKLQSQARDWSGARKTLRVKMRHGSLPRDLHRRRDAILAISEARDADEDSTSVAVQSAAIEANRLSPDLIPAAVMAARAQILRDEPRRAAKVIRRAWEAQPHPELAAAFAEIVPDESGPDRLKRFAALTRHHPNHAETRLLLAELNLAIEDFSEAKRSLGELPQTKPDARVLTILAAIERGQGASDQRVKGLLTRAIKAPRGPQWVCDNCQHVHNVWSAVCENCESFDTLSWTEPQKSDVTMPNYLEMYPLIVGEETAREDQVTEVAEGEADSQSSSEVMVNPDGEAAQESNESKIKL